MGKMTRKTHSNIKYSCSWGTTGNSQAKWRKPNTSVRWLCAIFWVTFGSDIWPEGSCYEWKFKYKLYRSFSIICRIVRLQSTRTNLSLNPGCRGRVRGGVGVGGWKCENLLVLFFGVWSLRCWKNLLELVHLQGVAFVLGQNPVDILA